MISYKLLTRRDEIAGILDYCGAMRILHFRKFPYLYAGSFEYETAYLEAFLSCQDAAIVVIYDRDEVVAIATGIPFHTLADCFGDAKQQFHSLGVDTSKYYYFGETIVESDYRRCGMGRIAYQVREQFAKERNYHGICLATVIREANHPQKPAGYVDPEPFWHKLGYCETGIIIENSYPTVLADGSVAAMTHRMRFWERRLSARF